VTTVGTVAVWAARPGRNSTTGSNTEEGDMTSSKSARDQFTLPIKINTGVVEVTHFAEVAHLSEAGTGYGIGLASLFEQELSDVMIDVISKPYTDSITKMGLNAQLFRDGKGTNDLGLDMNGLSYWIDDSSSARSGVSTVAGKTRSSYDNLYVPSDSFNSTSAVLAEKDIRNVIESCEASGANRNTMVLITSHKLRGRIFNMMSAGERYMTTEANFGFRTVPLPTFDGIGIYADKDCPSGVVWVVDLSTFELRELMPMRYVPLAKTATTEKGMVEYFANLICKNVHKNGILYNKS
jgi:hypothetical protein